MLPSPAKVVVHMESHAAAKAVQGMSPKLGAGLLACVVPASKAAQLAQNMDPAMSAKIFEQLEGKAACGEQVITPPLHSAGRTETNETVDISKLCRVSPRCHRSPTPMSAGSG